MEITNSQTDTQVLISQLRAEHLELEKRLAELNSHLSLTPEELVEKKRIQKLKLAKKDAIQALLSRHDS
jgi:uncharacterized protein